MEVVDQVALVLAEATILIVQCFVAIVQAMTAVATIQMEQDLVVVTPFNTARVATLIAQATVTLVIIVMIAVIVDGAAEVVIATMDQAHLLTTLTITAQVAVSL
ncbi:MAG: hypothetical protein JWP09_762 [Candidatus Taylorbacteria bacterium]|nr:hypothetical protein [Candidatus Taylorbacteria bacterium]